MSKKIDRYAEALNAGESIDEQAMAKDLLRIRKTAGDGEMIKNLAVLLEAYRKGN